MTHRDSRAPAVPIAGRADVADVLRSLGLNLGADAAGRLAKIIERDPTHAELALFDAMWSEHCSYKSTRHLLKTLPTQAANVVLGPGADAGVVRLPGPAHGAAPCIVIAHESHNHPSQLLPYEGAATGIGGIVRDVYCMGADVIGVLDVLRFGDPDGPASDRVRQIVRGVVDGIAGYGNALGVPNLGGEIEFDAAFDDNCLVNVIALGTLRESEVVPSRAPEAARTMPYVLVLVGKPTDDSGFGGASFASVELETDEDTQNRGAVQLPDPFFKRVLTEANHAALALLRQRGEAFAMKDLGAAGLGGAASEIAGDLGLALDLDAVHTDTRRPAAVVLVAETQERYALCVPEGVADDLLRVYNLDFELGAMVRGAGARIVGRFDATGRFRARHGGVVHVDVPTQLVTTPIAVQWPHAPRPAAPPAFVPARRDLEGRDIAADLRRVMGSIGGASRFPVFGHYDSDVQGHTAVRPGDADAGVVVPDRASGAAIAVATAGPARLGWRDAYRAGAGAVCEAARNVAAVGATPWALTDCLNFGSPENPECMQDLVDCVRGLSDAARALGLRGHAPDPLPFVSGNVSLYNQSARGRAIPPTPVVACFGVVADVGQCRVPAQRSPGDRLFRIGTPDTSLGGSLYALATGQHELLAHGALPPLRLQQQHDEIDALLDAFERGWITACRDVSAGGDIVALAEMSFGRHTADGLGARVHLDASGLGVARLFAEAPGFVCAVSPARADAFVSTLRDRDVAVEALGSVAAEPVLEIMSGSRSVCRIRLDDLFEAWRSGLDHVVRQEVLS